MTAKRPADVVCWRMGRPVLSVLALCYLSAVSMSRSASFAAVSDTVGHRHIVSNTADVDAVVIAEGAVDALSELLPRLGR